MSTATISTKRLEPALRHLASHGGAKVAVVAAKFQPEGTKLADFIAELWAWFKRYNMGRPNVSDTRINSALAQEKDLPAPAREKIQQALHRAALEPVSDRKAPVEPAPAADSAPNAARAGDEPFDQDDGSSPWAKRQRRPRANAVAHWRSRLVAIANGDKSGLEGPTGGSWWSCKRKWFGTSRPAPAMVERFLTWFDAGEAPAKPAPFKFKVREVTKPVGRLGRAARAQAAAATPPPASTDGWEELEIKTGRSVNYQVRYSGADCKNPTLSLPSSFVKSLPDALKPGNRVQVFLRKTDRYLRLVVGGDSGLLAREEHGGLRLASRSFPSLLGKAACSWRTKEDGVIGPGAKADLVFEPIAMGGEG